MLRENLHIFGILGCILCVVGSTTIVLHAPPEREIEFVGEVWGLATEPGILLSLCMENSDDLVAKMEGMRI